MQHQIKSFLDNLLGERGLSSHTLAAYEKDLSQFRIWLESCGISHPREITPDTVVSYLAALRRRSLAPATITRKTTALGLFARYLCREGVCVDDFTLTLELGRQKSQRLPATLSSSEIERLLNAPRLDTPEGIRDRAMLELMYGSGLRVSELVSLKTSGVDRQANLVRPFGKGSKERQIPLGERAKHAIESYLTNARPKLMHDKAPSPSLFVTDHGGPMDRRHFWLLIQGYAQDAQIAKHVTPHTLRHSFATDLLAGGADVRAIQEMMGHTNVETTQRYTRVDVSRLREAYDKAHPRA